MGEFTNGESPSTQAQDDRNAQAGDTGSSGTGTPDAPKGFETNVTGVRSDDQVKQGKDTFPCFDVSSQEFNQNMQFGRKRLRFKSGSNAQAYMKGSKYNRAFFIRHTDGAGKQFVRKIK